jgi:8-oxo-dGTP pyrophosphatase MutT (NUDIX family)
MMPDLSLPHGVAPAELTAEAFAALARPKLLPLAPDAMPGQETAADHQLDDPRPFILDPAHIRPAAVLIPIVARREATLLLTERAGGLAVHAGQVAFPGGRIEEGETALQAALREAHEEIGLEPARVSPLGALGPYLTGTGFRVTPIVALVEAEHQLVLNPFEVAEVFEPPLSFLMDPANHELRSGELRGMTRRFYAMPWRGHHIWGVTAGIIRTLYERVYGP